MAGTAPTWFELDTALFVSDEGDVSARFAGSYDFLVTQRLVAQPHIELNAAFDDATDYGIERGLTDLELGLRFRYEFRREIAPYVGVHWTRLIGATANRAEREGEDDSVVGFVAGLRFWF